MSDSIYIKASGTTLPSPTDIKISDELIWSENTGRGNTAGNITMSGDCLGEKKTISVTWGILSKSEFETIKSKMPGGFFNVYVYLGGVELNASCYRGNIEKEVAGFMDGTVYYRNVSVELVEK